MPLIMNPWRVLGICLVLVIVPPCAEGKVKCHDCMDTEKGWCHDTTCEDEYCYKANATFNGKRILKLGCMPRGRVGCERQHVHFPAIADAAGDFCICQTDFCNEALPAFAMDGNYTLLDYYNSSSKPRCHLLCLVSALVIMIVIWTWV